MYKQSQRARIVAYCKAHGAVTNLQITKELNIGSASKRISELRRDPRYRIQQEDKPVLDEKGKQRTHYMVYRITEVQNERSDL